jgi:hypothetical protein
MLSKGRVSGKHRIQLEQRREPVRGYNRIPGHDEPHIVCESMNTSQGCMTMHRDCMDVRLINKSPYDQELGKIECVFRIMR